MDSGLAIHSSAWPKKASTSGSSTLNGEVGSNERPRRRITRACDRCNQLRTKCNGHSPCNRCLESDSVCEYARTVRKRGKAPQKKTTKVDIDSASAVESTRRARSNSTNTLPMQEPATFFYDAQQSQAQMPPHQPIVQDTGSPQNHETSSAMLQQQQHHHQQQQSQQPPQYPLWLGVGADEYTGVRQFNGDISNSVQGRASTVDDGTASTSHASIDMAEIGLPIDESVMLGNGDDQAMRYPFYLEMDLESYDQLALDVAGAELLCGGRSNSQFYQSQSFQPHQPPANLAHQPLLRMQSDKPYDSSMSLSLVNQLEQQTQQHAHPDEDMIVDELQQSLRYPSLKPLLPYLKSIMDESLACDLLETYFDSLFDAPHPLSPYVFGFVVRKAALLHPTHPRVCSPAMLASILWISARTSTSPRLASDPTKRGTVCQQLLELTIRLLIPLMHGGVGIHANTASSSDPGNVNSSLGIVNPRPPLVSSHEDVIVTASYPGNSRGRDHSDYAGPTDPGQRAGSTVSLDDIVAYMHIATVTSASEDKRASLRWWGAAWTLALELKLGRELPESSSNKMEPLIGPSTLHHEGPLDAHGGSSGDSARASARFVKEEQKEERRRVWWILYLIDRHLSLCYNKPILLQNRDCDNLYQPMDESDWQNGSFWLYMQPQQQDVGGQHGPSAHSMYRSRGRGPSVEFSGPSIFGYMLPLMCILGEIIDLRYARSNPILASHLEANGEVIARHRAIESHLERYRRSMDAWARGAEDHQQQTALAYSTYLTHTLHILSIGRWDPIELLDDNDGWTRTPAFYSTMYHAIRASESITCILEIDPDLSFMPFMFGIYLLQSGFALLLIAEKTFSDPFPLSLSPPTSSSSTTPPVTAGGLSLNGFGALNGGGVGGGLKNIAGVDHKHPPISAGFSSASEKPKIPKTKEVMKACEAVVRAHEVCIVTLSTEYQKNFRNVMRSVLAAQAQRLRRKAGSRNGSTATTSTVNGGNNATAGSSSSSGNGIVGKGSVGVGVGLGAEKSNSSSGSSNTAVATPTSSGTTVQEQQQRKRREVLALYRWTADGGGLAL